MRGSRGVRGNSNFLKLSKLGLGPPPGKYWFPLDPPPPHGKKILDPRICMYKHQYRPIKYSEILFNLSVSTAVQKCSKNLNGLCESCADVLYIAQKLYYVSYFFLTTCNWLKLKNNIFEMSNLSNGCTVDCQNMRETGI